MALIDVFPAPEWEIVTSGYGYRWGRMHQGVDYGSPDPGRLPMLRAPVFAPFGGVVTTGSESGAGNWLWVASGGKLFKSFHLDSFAVRNGQRVEAGQLIAYSDNTGASTGSHNHWELWIDGQPIDPQPAIEAARGNVPPPPEPPEDEPMSAQDVAELTALINANDARLRNDLGVWEHDTRTVVINGVEHKLNAPIAAAGWASRPYLVGIEGEPAVYDLRRVEDDPYWQLVHISAPGTDGSDTDANQAWLGVVIQTSANPDVQWYNPERQADAVASLRSLPGYVASS
ncbi:MAG TPA: M23 family metallopeptidase [Acidimicrobiales bacterium]|nr:M23 family metallopeptidase [Acidimicrobiales bacterium]